jgi:hypothetical protein
VKARRLRFSRHRHRDVSIEAKGFRHLQITGREVLVGDIFAAGAGQQRAQP